MAKTGQIDVKEKDLLQTLRDFLASVLKTEEIEAILVPWQLPVERRVMPTLLTDPDRMGEADPLSPAFPLNGAKLLSRLTRKSAGARIAAVMRPCEIRAFVELVKLHQGSMEEVVIIGVDCLGAFRNRDFFSWVGDDVSESSRNYAARVLNGNDGAVNGIEPAPACKACEHPVATGADISVGLYGMEPFDRILVQAHTSRGEMLFSKLRTSPAEEPSSRKKAIDQIVSQRSAFRDAMFESTHAATDSLEKLAGYLANCVNCYNCRVACPVCYCRECVFVTDVFDHEPTRYLRWALGKGALKMPTDTAFFHITRLAHMSTACVGCGQCSNACPNDIPVMELFRTIANATQKGFAYEAGMDLEQRPPLSEFREDEFPEVVGIE